MSRQSRKRLMDWLQTFDHEKMSAAGALFVRLSYKELPPDSKEAHRGLNAFLDRLDYHLDKPVTVWRQEFGERRGRLHFHLMIYGMHPAWVDDVELRKREIARHWQDASAPYGGFIHQVEMACAARVGRYIAKYVAKDVESSGPAPGAGPVPDGAGATGAGTGECANLLKAHILGKEIWQGRTWGIRNREKIVIAQAETVALQVDETSTEAVARLAKLNISFMRIARNWVKANHRASVEHLRQQLLGQERNMYTGRLINKTPFCKKLVKTGTFGIYATMKNGGRDWSGPVAWRMKGKARDGFLKWRGGDWPRFTLYVPPTFDVFRVMEWISGHLVPSG